MEYSHTFPTPPSVNQLYRAVRGRSIKSKAYRDWEKLVDGFAYLVPRKTLQKPVQAVYAFGRPDNRRRDLGNLEKATSDLLQRWGVLTDDSDITDIRLYWADDVEPGMVRVQLHTLSPS